MKTSDILCDGCVYDSMNKTEEQAMTKLQMMPLEQVIMIAGCPAEAAEAISEAGGNTHSLVSVASVGNLAAFTTSVQGLLSGKDVVSEWHLAVLYGYLQTQMAAKTLVSDMKKLSVNADSDQDSDLKDLTKLQAELGIKSLSPSMAALKALCIEVGPDGIDIPDKVTNAILGARKGKTPGTELVMQVSGCGDVVPKMAAGVGTRKAVWSLARKNWVGLMVFAKKVKRILVRVGGDRDGEDAAQAWEFFIEFVSDLAEIKGEKFAGEYVVAYTSEYDFTFQDGEGKIRPPNDEKIKMMTQKYVKSSLVDSDDEWERVDARPPKKGPRKSEGPCLKCGGKHGVFSCPSRCKTNGHCVVCGKKRTECTSMFDCEERHEDSK